MTTTLEDLTWDDVLAYVRTLPNLSSVVFMNIREAHPTPISLLRYFRGFQETLADNIWWDGMATIDPSTTYRQLYNDVARNRESLNRLFVAACTYKDAHPTAPPKKFQRLSNQDAA